MSKNIVFEGWLTKSPPMKRIWRTKWRRRWFALRQSGDLPGQYFLDYYADRNRRRLKGTINLDLCEQVDAGLHMERNTHGTLDPKLRGSVFTIQTQLRTYHLEADSEADMTKWVDAICRVCGLRSTEEESPDVIVTYQSNPSTNAVINEQYGCANSTSPYIPISECITGVRSQDTKPSYTFNPRNIVINTRTPFERSARRQQIYMSQPYIRPPNTYAEFSENDSNLSEDESRSLNASQSNIRNWSPSKSFTKSPARSSRNGYSDGPPVPPRPPKTFSRNKDYPQRERSQSPRFLHPRDAISRELESHSGRTLPWTHGSRRNTSMTPSSPRRYTQVSTRYDNNDDAYNLDHLSMQYCNMSVIPPMVDRNLKPRLSNHNIPQVKSSQPGKGVVHTQPKDEAKSDVLQYLDLDLDAAKSDSIKPKAVSKKSVGVHHGKSFSASDSDCAYKTVDFLKTEAFNITRKDAEASRSNQQ